MSKRKLSFHLIVIAIVLVSYILNYVQKPVSKVAESTTPTPLPSITLSPSPSDVVLGATTSTDATSSAVKVVKVVDGDTIKVEMNGKTETVRLIGVDTPETVDPRKAVQCFGKQASDETKHLLLDQLVTLIPDPTQDDRDKYRRLLRYVYLPDGTDVGQLLISEGFAHEYTYKVPYLHQKTYKEDQKAVEAAKRGLWADNACSL